MFGEQNSRVNIKLRKCENSARKLMNVLQVPAVLHGRELELSAELSEAERRKGRRWNSNFKK